MLQGLLFQLWQIFLPLCLLRKHVSWSIGLGSSIFLWLTITTTRWWQNAVVLPSPSFLVTSVLIFFHQKPFHTFTSFFVPPQSSCPTLSFFFSLCRKRCRSRQCSSSDKLFNLFVLFNHAGRWTFYCLHLHLRARITRFVSIHQPPPETFTPSHSPQASFFFTRIGYLQIHNNALRKGGRRSGTGCPCPGGSSTFVDRGIKTYR